MISKRVVAGAGVAAAVVGFLASLVTVVGFFGFDGWTGSAPTEEPAAVTLPTDQGGITSVAAPVTTPPVVPASETVLTSAAALVPTPQTKPRPPAVNAGAPQPAVPQSFHGKWFGQVYQGSSDPYPVEVVIAGGASGATIASVDYPNLRCGGRWELAAAWDNKISAVERIEYQGTCVDSVRIDLVMQPDGQAFYSFKGHGDGAGVLRRLR
ncbi:hypothetical protein JNUCC0626_24215 [Lentzea sp. JNUCC 0626]|uniref:hypothetical protein n=1 Tax=Lentzea sp. JNUCC 0626 TaxID=3367513 RepID=UPI003748B2B2